MNEGNGEKCSCLGSGTSVQPKRARSIPGVVRVYVHCLWCSRWVRVLPDGHVVKHSLPPGDIDWRTSGKGAQ